MDNYQSIQFIHLSLETEKKKNPGIRKWKATQFGLPFLGPRAGALRWARLAPAPDADHWEITEKESSPKPGEGKERSKERSGNRQGKFPHKKSSVSGDKQTAH